MKGDMLLIREWDHKEDSLQIEDGRTLPIPERFEKKDYNKANLEIGSGNGLFLTQMASRKKDESFFGIERLAKCINKTVRKIEKQKIDNVILINGDVFTALDRFFEREFFDAIYINFPDPWFKRRDLRKRVVQEDTAKRYYGYLKDGGRLYFVTDNEDYRDDGINSLLANRFAPLLEKPHYSGSLNGYPVSLYEEKWRKEERGIFYSVFEKNDSSKE
jgi:tRNA (guanine-N7-)-methyltransferase